MPAVEKGENARMTAKEYVDEALELTDELYYNLYNARIRATDVKDIEELSDAIKYFDGLLEKLQAVKQRMENQKEVE